MNIDGDGNRVSRSKTATKLAVMFVHGVEIDNPHFADGATARLKKAFARYSGADPDEALVLKPAFWAQELDVGHDELLNRLGGGGATSFFRTLSRWATATDAGSGLALAALVLSGLVRRLPGARDFHFPTMRWLTVHYVGDAVAYQINSSERELYDRVHAVVARTLTELAAEAGENAPLCVIAHSLGSVVASNFFYDLEVEAGCYGEPRKLKGRRVARSLGSSPVERGETLSFLYTLGSPMALWAARLPDRGTPLIVPHPRAAHHNPKIKGEWVNVYAPDDVISSPLKQLNDRYDRQVAEDRGLSVGPWWLSWSPLSHPWYWNDDRVIDPIAASLAEAWHALRATGNGASTTRGVGACVTTLSPGGRR